ncbi:MAG: hypothetical protein NTW08_03085 [Gammaproteobacteria bacterium]|nr:hypothetical protein [Gammaproteobacteria bacterium]
MTSLGVFSAPAFLLTHNLTDSESNAYIVTRDGGAIPSIYPTKPHAVSKVYWNMVKLACHGHSVNNICSAIIKMNTNTASPIEIGVVTMDLATGEISPKQLSANGYTVTVNGLAETTLTQP